MADLNKKLRSELRALVAKAYEAELRRALTPLYEHFHQWHARKISSFKLSDLIHEFHHGPSRDLYVAYRDRIVAESRVARAIATGIVNRADVSEELLEYLDSPISMYEADAKRASDSGPAQD